MELCQWLLDCITFSLEILSGLTPGPTHDVFYLHSEIQDMKVWHNVFAEKEANPDAMLRQQMAEQSDYKTKYDYISFKGASATLSRQFRNMIAHLHVCLGHIGSEKLCRMLALNGAKDAVLQGVKDLHGLPDLQSSDVTDTCTEGGFCKTHFIQSTSGDGLLLCVGRQWFQVCSYASG